jgi:hypothetical protein
MRPIIHFVVGDFVLREELKKLFSKHNNIIIDNSNLSDVQYDEITLYVSLTSCLLSSILKTHNVYFEHFKHNEQLEEKIKALGNYNNNKELLLPYHNCVIIQVDTNYIAYIPIKYSNTSKLPISHLYNAFSMIYQEVQKYNIKYVVIPLDTIIQFDLNNSINQYVANTIYEAAHYFY